MERVRITPRIMHEFEIDELSAVDKPAQASALATIIKRDDGKFRHTPFVPVLKVASDRHPLVHDEDTQKLLDLKHEPLTGSEQYYATRMSTEKKRTFVLADHAKRQEMMDQMTDPALLRKKPEQTERKDDEMSSVETYKSFAEVKEHFQKTGMRGDLAMTAARQARPDLFKALQSGETSITKAQSASVKYHADVQKVHDDGLTKRQTIDAMVGSTANAQKCSRTDALRIIKRERPELFE